MRLGDNIPVDAANYTWGQRGDGSRRLPGMAGAEMSWFGSVFDPRLNMLTDSDTHHDWAAIYSWGLDDAQDASGGFLPPGDKGAPQMGQLGDTPETNEPWHGYGIKGDETRLSQDKRSPNVIDDNPNQIDPAIWDQLVYPERISEKPIPVPGRGPGDPGTVPNAASPQLQRGDHYNILRVSKRFSETMSHGDLGTPFAALPEWQEFGVANAAPTPTSSGATEPNTRTRQSTFTTIRIPPSQWGGENAYAEQATGRWGA